ncbi:MAG: hypothetical protein M3461_01075 [Pseudomonadota bacterium]|nr:hypothetical protein [Pseudomonadota bacterium]
MIIAVDLMDNKLEYAKQFGATHTVNPGRQGREAWATEVWITGCRHRRRSRLKAAMLVPPPPFLGRTGPGSSNAMRGKVT